MIEIKDKCNCCGCNACVQSCPKQCIVMQEDEEGFLYPSVDISKCIACGLCERICPIINQSSSRQPIVTYAAKNTEDSVRLASSSGGVFNAIAETVIANGGVVFGARFDKDWMVEHAFTETIEGLAEFRGSKYAQSRIGETFSQAEHFLKQGREVLYSGTPCQIAGLKSYLRRDFPNLLAVEVICHGVPSPLVWKDYINKKLRPTGAVAGKNTDFLSLNMVSVITDISFRDKRCGWEKYGFSARYAARKGGKNSDFQHVNDLYEPFNENLFMRGFLLNLYLRPSCYSCRFKNGKSTADLCLGDFWGIKNNYPELHDNIGMSLVLCSTRRGETILNESQNLKLTEVTYESGICYNKCYERSVAEPKYRHKFWLLFQKHGIEATALILRKMAPSIPKRIVWKLRSLLRIK